MYATDRNRAERSCPGCPRLLPWCTGSTVSECLLWEPFQGFGISEGNGDRWQKGGVLPVPWTEPPTLAPPLQRFLLALVVRVSPSGAQDCPKIATGSVEVAVALPADPERGARSRWAGDACQFAAATATRCEGVSGPAGAERSSRGTHPGPPPLACHVTFVCPTGGIWSPEPVENEMNSKDPGVASSWEAELGFLFTP